MKIEYEITALDHLEMLRNRRSRLLGNILSVCLGLYGVALATVLYSYMDHTVCITLIVVCTMSIMVHLLSPYIVHRRVYYSNRRLFGWRTLQYDENGLISDGPIGYREIKWSQLDRFRETTNLFLLYLTRDAAAIVPKRAFRDPQSLDEFRKVLASKLRRA